MSINRPKHHRPFDNAQGRRSIRLPGNDYSREGAYYITICTQDRKCLFGKIRNGKIALSECGRTVENWWQKIPKRYSGVILDEYVIMPNHMHAIIVITDDVFCRGEVASPLGGSVDILAKPGDGMKIPGETTPPMGESVDGITIPGEVTTPLRGTGKHTLGQILAFYKYQTTKSINAIYNSPGNKIWQRNYWEHVIRNVKSLNKIREYIRANPWHWAADDENPDRKIKTQRVRAIHELPQQ